ncbi:MAG TPA: type II secretion system F family protein [Chloroflexota bacterium]|nr:type II secretion system F family protein [Chloroflexota bacterium]
MEPVAGAVAAGAAVATLLIAAAVGRGLRVRLAMRRREQRFLDFGTPAPPKEAPVTAPRAGRARLATMAAAHRTTLLLGALALALLVVGGLVNWALGVLLAAAVLGAAGWRAARRDAGRRARLETQLVPALRMMASALESGYSIPQALERVARDSPAPIAEEFGQVMRAVELGTPLDTALGGLAARGEDFEFFATIVAVQHRVGGDLPGLLTSLASSIQDRLTVRAEVRALTAQARYSGWVLSALPFVVLGWMLLVSPTYASPLFSTDLGRAMLLFGGLLLVAGLATIRSISRVEL